MIEQQNNRLLISFPSPEAAAQAKRWMEIAVLPWLLIVSQSVLETSDPLSAQPQGTPVSPESGRSRHVVLTDDRLEALSSQRETGQTERQRILKAQTTLRDGTLPFRALDEPPRPSGQASPRQKAQAEGGFADGSGVAPEVERRKSRLRPVNQFSPKPSQS